MQDGRYYFDFATQEFARQQCLRRFECNCNRCKIIESVFLGLFDGDWVEQIGNQTSENIREIIAHLLNTCNLLLDNAASAKEKEVAIFLADIAYRSSLKHYEEYVRLSCSYMGAACQNNGDWEIALPFLLRSIDEENYLCGGATTSWKIVRRRSNIVPAETAPAAILVRICQAFFDLSKPADAVAFARRAIRAAYRERNALMAVEAVNWQTLVRNSMAYSADEEREATEIALLHHDISEDFVMAAENCHAACLKLRRQGLYVAAVQKLASLTEQQPANGLNQHLTLLVKKCGDQLLKYGHPREAEPMFMAAKERWQQIGATAGVAACYQALGSVDARLNRFKEALLHNRSALASYEELGDCAAQARIHCNNGGIYADLADHVSALGSFQQSVVLFDRAGANRENKKWKARCFLGLGAVYLEQFDDTNARSHLESSLSISESIDDSSAIAQCVSRIGEIYIRKHDYQSALGLYDRALSHALISRDSTVSESLRIQRAHILTILDRVDEALSELNECMGVAEANQFPYQIAMCATRLGYVYQRLRQPGEAFEQFDRALEIRKGIGAPDSIYECYRHIADCHNGFRNFPEAAAAYRDAIAFLERSSERILNDQQQGVFYFEACIRVFHALIEILMLKEDAAQVLEYAERSKARTLRASWRKEAVGAHSRTADHDCSLGSISAANSFHQLEVSWAERCAPYSVSYNLSVGSNADEAPASVGSLQSAPPDSRGELRSSESDRIKECLQDSLLLPNYETAAIEYVVTPDKICLIVVVENPDDHRREVSVRWLEESNTDIAAMVQEMQQALSDNSWDFDDPARRLYQSLVAPVEHLLDRCASVCIVPDGFLWNLAFQALRDADGRYLLERWSVMYAPSLSLLNDVQLRPIVWEDSANVATDTHMMMVVANPLTTEDSDDLPALPETERQAYALQALYGKEKCRVLVGKDALKQAILAEAPRYRILHFAVHGEFDNDEPLNSALVFSDTTGFSSSVGDQGTVATTAESIREAKLLRARELLGLRLKADLVVLSSCDTGKGRGSDGEGSVGLAWAFAVAGSPRTVVSQWQAYSDSAADLMISLYEDLELGQGTAITSGAVAAGLRQAALAMLHSPTRYSHPHYWAPFALISCAW